MRKKILIIMFIAPLLLLSQSEKQQKRQDKLEKIESSKIAFLSKKLNLSVEEAQAFWPVYNEYTDQIKSIKQKNNHLIKERKNINNLDENQVEVLNDKKFKIEQQILETRIIYHKEYQKILSNKQIAVLYDAEQEFKKRLLKRMNKK